jgi:hypothetical protein
MDKKEKIIEKQKELIIVLTKALDFLADNNLIKEKRDNNDTDNQPLIDCVNESSDLRKQITSLESQPDALEAMEKYASQGQSEISHAICKGCGNPIDTFYCQHCKELLES